MAIRSTNMNRAARAYNPNTQAASRSPRQPPRNTDGPGNSHLDYGPPKPFNQRDQYDAKREKYGDSPWYGRSGKPMPWSGPPGQERGQRAPFFTPDASDPRNAGYWVAPPSAEEQAAYDAAQYRTHRERDARVGSLPGYDEARAGSFRDRMAFMHNARRQMQRQPLGDQGGPAPGGGRSMHTAPQYVQPDSGWWAGQSEPGMGQNLMFDGYSPGASKSGMGQMSAMGGGFGDFLGQIQAGTGNPMGGGMMGNAMGVNYGGGSPMGGNMMVGNPMGGGMGGGLSPMGGGLPPQFIQMLSARGMGGGGMGGFGSGGFGGYNPMAQSIPFGGMFY